MITLTINTADEMAELGARLAAELRAGDLLALNGELGAGKTTLTRGLGAALAVRGTVTSPTFVLARTHPRLFGGAPLVHVDAYRLSSPAELDDLDIDYAASIVVVEWAAGMLDGLTEDWLEIAIARPMGGAGSAVSDDDDDDDTDDEPRVVTISGHGARWEGFALDR